MFKPLVLACLLASWLVVAGHVQADEETPAAGLAVDELGETTFPNSGSPAAQPDFMRGLLQLHSFEFAAARKSFQAALARNPGFVMGHWGEALSYNMPIWGLQDLEAARAVLARLGPTPEERAAMAPTERERDYLASIEQLYGDGDKAERDAHYSAALGALAKKYPEDLDARSLYALSLLGLTGSTRDIANYMRAAAEAETVYEINNRHPGALHYLIHAYDDPVHAPLGLRAARRYGKVARGAAHAQHMPSHIFFALGMWDDAIGANVASLATARSQGVGGYHALEWLAYAYLQQGRRDEAAELLRSVEAGVAASPAAGSRASLASLRAMWLAETGGATGVDAWADVDSTGISSIRPFSAHDFARGIVAARAGRLDAAAAALASLQARTGTARERVLDVAAGHHDAVTPQEIEQAGILAAALQGAIQFGRGERDAGVTSIREAIATADTMAFEYGPPWSAKPLDELLGDLLMDAGRPAEATHAYEKALAVHPNRKLARQGLIAAQAAAWQCRHCTAPAAPGVGPR